MSDHAAWLSRFLSLCMLALAASLMAACTSEIDFSGLAAGPDCLAGCKPQRSSHWHNRERPDQAGFSVEVVAWGHQADTSGPIPTDIGVDKDQRTVATGAPLMERGRVYALPAGFVSGELEPDDRETIDGPFFDTLEFGFALAATDVRDGRYAILPPPVRDNFIAWGEELIVGAPGTGDDMGEIYWYESSSLGWSYGNAFVPPGLMVGDRFGAAIAVPDDLDARKSTRTETEVPDWIAVGAPGGNDVYLLAVDSTLSQPFSVLQVLSSPTGWGAFGASLAIVDFDGDGWRDLAVGLPEMFGGGQVYLYRGNATGVDPSPTAISSSWVGTRAFGTSMDAGAIFHDLPERPVLVVGDPEFDVAGTETGAVCGFVFYVAPGGRFEVEEERCWTNRRGIGVRWGAAVAVGNFMAEDAAVRKTSSCAAGEELAVGAPWALDESGLLGVAGRVDVLACDETGPDTSRDPLKTIYGTRNHMGLGSSLRAEYVQSNVHQDLAIGAPLRNLNHGSVALSRAVPVGGIEDEISGKWEATDSAGDAFTVAISWNGETLTPSMRQAARITAVDELGNVCCINLGGGCQDVDFAGRIPLPSIPWLAETGEDHGEDIPIEISDYNITLDGHLAYDASAHTLTLSVDPPALLPNDCHLQNVPFVFQQTEATTCE